MSFTLPQLPYAYEALVPYMDAKTLEIHYTKHHQGYLNKLNTSLKQMSTPPTSITKLLIHIHEYDTHIRNNAGGYYNHNLFWASLSPTPTPKPSGALYQAISKHFGSLQHFMDNFTASAMKLFGSGWTWLCVDQQERLHILNTPNQDNPWMHHQESGLVPLIALDIWEHAYYLQYQNRRDAYIGAFWYMLDWAVIMKRYETFCQTKKADFPAI